MHKKMLCFLLFFYCTSALADSSLEKIGSVIQYSNPLLALAVTVGLKDTEGMREWLYATSGTLAVTSALKKGLNDVKLGHLRMGERPNGGDNNFPSGHTSIACSGAYFITKRYGWEYGFTPLGFAVITGISRVHAQKHTIPAVIAGCALGIAVNEYLVTPTESAKPIQIVPYADDKEFGIIAELRW